MSSQYLSRVVAIFAIAAALTPMASAQNLEEISKDIAPSGHLRAVINLGNPILARRDINTSEPVGVSVDLARELAKKFNLPLTLIPVNSAAASVEAVTQGQADMGFFAIDPIRGKGIIFTPAYLLIEGSYLVKQDSPLNANVQVDQAQHRVVVGKGSAYDLFLTRTLKQAQLVRAPTSPQVVPLLLDGNYEVAAGVTQQLQADSLKTPGLRLLPGRFMVIEQAIGQPIFASQRSHDALVEFIHEMKSNGFIQDSLSRHHIDGAIVAP